MKTCIACGMPMQEAKDFAMGDTSKDYCLYCANEDGSMQNFQDKLAGMTAFIVKTQGLDPQAAENSARTMMSKLPAWKNNF